MKKIISVIVAALIIVSVFAFAENTEPETRVTTIVMEGIETEIIETKYTDETGYSIWYQADLFQVNTVDDQAHFFAIDSTAEGEQPGLGASSSYMLVVPADIDPAEADAFIIEATGGFDPSVATISEVTTETREDGIVVRSVFVEDESNAYSFYLLTDGEQVLCVSTICPLEAMEGWGLRFDNMVKSIEF